MSYALIVGSPADVDARKHGVNARTFFSTSLSFSETESLRFASVCARSMEETKAAVEASYSLENLRPLDVVSFAQYSVVLDDDIGYCISLALLRDAIGLNFQHRYLDRTAFPSDADRKTFLDYRGPLFGFYIEDLLVRTFGASNVIGSLVLEERAGGAKSCDVAVLFGECVVLIEMKSVLLTLGVRSGESIESYSKLLDKSLMVAAVQLSDTIDLLMGGACIDLGFDPAVVKRCFPVIGTMEISLNESLSRRLDQECADKKILNQSVCQPLQVMNVEELETVEIAQEFQRDLCSLLTAKIRDPETRGMSFKNFCVQRGEPWIYLQNPFLQRRFEELAVLIKDWLRINQRP